MEISKSFISEIDRNTKWEVLNFYGACRDEIQGHSRIFLGKSVIFQDLPGYSRTLQKFKDVQGFSRRVATMHTS